MKQLEVTLRVRNNLIKERRRLLGLSQRDAATMAGVSITTWNGYETFKLKAVTKDGAWRPSALTVAAALAVEPGELWPTALQLIEHEHLKRLFHKVDSDDLIRLAGVGDYSANAMPALQRGLDVSEVHAAVATLRPREASVIHSYFFEEQSTTVIARALGVSESRVTQIRNKALTRLRKTLSYRDRDAESDLRRWRRNRAMIAAIGIPRKVVPA